MSSEKVARLLTDFDQQEPLKSSSRVVPFDYAQHSARSQPKPAAVPPPPPEDDGYQRGRAEGYASALAEFEQKLDYERSKMDAQLDEQRHQLLEETAERVAGAIADVGDQLETKIAGVTARLLEPVISGAVQRQAVASFVEKLSSLATDSRRPMLRITGPSEVLDLVRGKLGVRSIAIELRVEPVAEVSVTVDEVILESQLKIWADRLKFAVLT
jgi:flagellar biosynthesis/type III secretory pathway protein FliH